MPNLICQKAQIKKFSLTANKSQLQHSLRQYKIDWILFSVLGFEDGVYQIEHFLFGQIGSLVWAEEVVMEPRLEEIWVHQLEERSLEFAESRKKLLVRSHSNVKLSLLVILGRFSIDKCRFVCLFASDIRLLVNFKSSFQLGFISHPSKVFIFHFCLDLSVRK